MHLSASRIGLRVSGNIYLMNSRILRDNEKLGFNLYAFCRGHKVLEIKVVAYCILMAFGGVASAQLTSHASPQSSASPEFRQSAEFYSQTEMLSGIYRNRSDEFIVDHELPMPAGENTVSAKRIVFRPHAKLVLSAANFRNDVFYIVVDQLDIEGEASVSLISEKIGDVPPDRQRAPDGGLGRGDGANGGPGADGQAGNVGYPGRSAPSVVLAFRRFAGSGVLSFDIRGAPGGVGGKGQDGGSGGDGGRGTPASQSLVDCKRGPGPGGKGGDGGNGGPAGNGGNGGNGGDVVMFTIGETAKDISRVLVYNAGGDGGAPGQPGQPGLPGHGGEEGEKQLPFCAAVGRNGANGSVGSQGAPGKPGTPGAPGRFLVVPLPDRLIAEIYQSN
jgi:hypothetical protein